MALTLTNLTGYQSGIEVAEVGMNLESFSITYKPEFKRKLPNHLGQTTGFVQPSVPSAELTMTGEVNSALGQMAATFYVALTITNDVGLFGRTAGTFWLDEATEEQSRDGWRRITIKASSDPLITVAS